MRVALFVPPGGFSLNGRRRAVSSSLGVRGRGRWPVVWRRLVGRARVRDVARLARVGPVVLVAAGRVSVIVAVLVSGRRLVVAVPTPGRRGGLVGLIVAVARRAVPVPFGRLLAVAVVVAPGRAVTSFVVAVVSFSPPGAAAVLCLVVAPPAPAPPSLALVLVVVVDDLVARSAARAAFWLIAAKPTLVALALPALGPAPLVRGVALLPLAPPRGVVLLLLERVVVVVDTADHVGEEALVRLALRRPAPGRTISNPLGSDSGAGGQRTRRHRGTRGCPACPTPSASLRPP